MSPITVTRRRRPHPARLARQVTGAGSVAGLLFMAGCMATGASSQGATPAVHLDSERPVGWADDADTPIEPVGTLAPVTRATAPASTARPSVAPIAKAAVAPAAVAPTAAAPAAVAPATPAPTVRAATVTTARRTTPTTVRARPAAPAAKASSSSHSS